jgi:hypothetical protein
LFRAGDVDELICKISEMWKRIQNGDGYSMNGAVKLSSPEEYMMQLVRVIE